MLSLEWLPLAWLRTVMLALIIYILFPRSSLSLSKISSKLGLSELHVYYLIIAFWEFVTVIILLYLMRLNTLPLSILGFQGGLTMEGVIYAVLGTVVGGLLYPAVEYLMKILRWSMFWRRPEERDWFPSNSDYLTSKRGLISMFLIVVVIIPILEEIIFRGYVLTVLLQHFDGILIPFVLSSIIFASIHCLAGPGFMLLIFIETFISSFLFWKFGNLYPCILLHALNTTLGEIVIPLYEKKGKKG
jgi:membrane protease YdiL (CAAX protease family)